METHLKPVRMNNTASTFEDVYRFDRCEVTFWKDGAVTITSSDKPKSPIITVRCAANPWCGRE